MLEMPDLFERHMTLGELAFIQEDYETARDHFEEAYELKDEISANVGLAKSFIQLKLFEEAYGIISEKKAFYLKEAAFHESYFHTLLQLNYFFEIELFLLHAKTTNLEDFQKAYEIAKDYHLLIYKEKFNKIEEELSQLGKVPPVEQGIVLKQLIYLPKEIVAKLARKLLIEEEVTIFSRSELARQLVELQLKETFTILTFKGELKPFVPKEMLSLNQMYQSSVVLKEITDYFAQNNPSLEREVTRQVKLHMGCLYPFTIDVMKPSESWVASYLKQYQGITSELDLSPVFKVQERLDQEVFKLFSYE